jgi:hypothetical protein
VLKDLRSVEQESQQASTYPFGCNRVTNKANWKINTNQEPEFSNQHAISQPSIVISKQFVKAPPNREFPNDINEILYQKF